VQIYSNSSAPQIICTHAFNRRSKEQSNQHTV